MNITIIGIGIVVVIALVGAVVGCIKTSLLVSLLYVLGLIALAVGVYLLPATMWRNISIGFLVIGVLLELIAIAITVINKKKTV